MKLPPRRAVELHGLTEASQGRTPPRKPRSRRPRRKRNLWDPPQGRSPRHASVRHSSRPRSALIGQPHDRGENHRGVAKRRCDGGPPAELPPNWDDPRCPCDRVMGTLVQVSPLVLIGRQGARTSFWDATFLAMRGKQPASQANGAPARAPLRVWCRWRSQRQPQDRTSRCPDRLVAARLHPCSLRSPLPAEGKKRAESGCALLTRKAIYVLDGVCCCP